MTQVDDTVRRFEEIQFLDLVARSFVLCRSGGGHDAGRAAVTGRVHAASSSASVASKPLR